MDYKYYIELLCFYKSSNKRDKVKEELRILTKDEIHHVGYDGQTCTQLKKIDIFVIGYHTLDDCEK